MQRFLNTLIWLAALFSVSASCRQNNQAHAGASGSPDDDAKERREDLDKLRTELNQRDFAASDNYDKAILTFASAGLGFSLALYKDFIPHDCSGAPFGLKATWCFFGASIIVIVFSYVIVQKSYRRQYRLYRTWYESDDDATPPVTRWAYAATAATWSAGLFFCCAVIALITTAIMQPPIGSADNSPGCHRNVSIPPGSQHPNEPRTDSGSLPASAASATVTAPRQ